MPIGVAVIVIGLGMVFLPVNLFFYFISLISILIILVGIREIIILGLKAEKSFLIYIVTVLMIFYFAVSIVMFFSFASGFKTGSNAQGWYLLMLAPAGLQDAIAYGVGTTRGKHKILALKNISSNKTWEGTFFGMIAGFFLAMVILEFNFSYVQLWQKLLTSLIISICAFFGDLLESKFKRILGVKDSGTVMKGHGGLLDRIDSQLLAIYGIYALTFWFL